MAVIILILSLVIFTSTAFGLPREPLVDAAVYFSEKHQYDEALKLWEKLAKRYPADGSILLKLCDTQLLLHGKAKARETLVSSVSSKTFSPENKQLIRKRLGEINALFVTDEGQSNYYQAISRAHHGDYQRAESLLEFAHRSEGGNTRVLRELARCQIKQLELERYANTLRLLISFEPFEWAHPLALSDVCLHLQRPNEALEILESVPELSRGLELKTRLAVALYEMERHARAASMFKELAQQPKVHPTVWYYLGKISETSKKPSALSTHYYRLFVETTEKSMAPSSLDPFRLKTRLAEIKRQLDRPSETKG